MATVKSEFDNVAKRLKYLRCKKGISRREVAALAGIDHTRYGQMERQLGGLQLRTLLSIIKSAYKLSLTEFLTFTLPKNMPEEPHKRGTGKRKKKRKAVKRKAVKKKAVKKKAKKRR